MAVAADKTLAEIFLFLHNNTSAATSFNGKPKKKFKSQGNMIDFIAN